MPTTTGMIIFEDQYNKPLSLSLETIHTKGDWIKMRRSKLEMYIDILRVLAHNGPMKLTHIMYKANVNCNMLKQSLKFLTQQNLIEEQTLRQKRNKIMVVYTTTERGKTILKYFRELNTALQITEEANKIPALLY